MTRGKTSFFKQTKCGKKLAVEGTAVGKRKISNEPIMIGSDAISVEHEDAYLESDRAPAAGER
jgi:hypothetical protein